MCGEWKQQSVQTSVIWQAAVASDSTMGREKGSGAERSKAWSNRAAPGPVLSTEAAQTDSTLAQHRPLEMAQSQRPGCCADKELPPELYERLKHEET